MFLGTDAPARLGSGGESLGIEMPRRRILIFTHEYPPFPGGIARYASELARAAAEAGDEVHVVAPDYGQEWGPDSKAAGNLLVHRVRAKEYRGSRLPGMVRETLFHLGRGPWDHVHAADIAYMTVLAFVARFRSLRFQGTAHGTDILSLRRSLSAKLLCGGNPYAFCERVLCNSSFTRDLLHQSFPSLSREISLVTHLGVNASLFEDEDGKQEPDLRRRLGVRSGDRIVLTVSRIERRKGHLAVIDALENCWSEGIRDFHYVVVGGAADDAYVTELRERASRVSFPVTFAGVMSETQLRSLYRDSAIFCMPGIHVPDRIEGFGLAYLEAAACSLPCIGTRLGGVGEVVRDQETGILLSDAEPRRLGVAIRSLLLDEPRRRSMAEAARAWAGTFTWSRCARISFGDFKLPPDIRLCSHPGVSGQTEHVISNDMQPSSL